MKILTLLAEDLKPFLFGLFLVIALCFFINPIFAWAIGVASYILTSDLLNERITRKWQVLVLVLVVYGIFLGCAILIYAFVKGEFM